MRLTLFLFFGLALLSPPAARAQQQGAGQNCEQHAGRVYTQGRVDEKAKVTRRHLPLFPEAARRKNIRRGEVMLRLALRPDGTVTDIEVVRTSDESFNKASIEAAKKTTFEPARKGGCPVAQWLVLMSSYRSR